ncbi:MAG: hypothetical protein AAGI71_17505 [Bacteroidota bacterium]
MIALATRPCVPEAPPAPLERYAGGDESTPTVEVIGYVPCERTHALRLYLREAGVPFVFRALEAPVYGSTLRVPRIPGFPIVVIGGRTLVQPTLAQLNEAIEAGGSGTITVAI